MAKSLAASRLKLSQPRDRTLLEQCYANHAERDGSVSAVPFLGMH
ncbi:hypothetical protein [Almyronema epifaneia]|uniref:Uncharacterized protein n=1 Tax=Almyronema epifaneia S1 TaxID=2991925 RepID=A0ABW6IET9_9CYAN